MANRQQKGVYLAPAALQGDDFGDIAVNCQMSLFFNGAKNGCLKYCCNTYPQ
jgi:hypothetical protein